MTKRKILTYWFAYALLSGCASFESPSVTELPIRSDPAPRQAQARISDDASAIESALTPATAAGADVAANRGDATAIPATVSTESPATARPQPLSIEESGQTGQVENTALDEISGLVVSRQTPGVLFALNDSGNPAELYAMSETGADLGHWQVNARNRDWEDMANVRLEGKDYLVLGDTGDNLRIRRESVLYLVEEPSLDTPANTVLEPERRLRFRYEDGPRNVEAFAISDGIVYLISKEPVGQAGAQASRLYTLTLPEQATDEQLTARFAGELPLAKSGLEARLAAAVAGVDLNHPTALDFDALGNTAYVLTYRHVLRIRRRAGQSWIEALTTPSERIHSHTLWQAEALAVSAGQSIWLTSENTAAPIWALPIRPPS